MDTTKIVGTLDSSGHKRGGKLPLYCSFCGKSDDAVCKMVAGPSVFICNECVHLCLAMIEDNTMQDKQIESSATPQKS